MIDQAIKLVIAEPTFSSSLSTRYSEAIQITHVNSAISDFSENVGFEKTSKTLDIFRGRKGGLISIHEYQEKEDTESVMDPMQEVETSEQQETLEVATSNVSTPEEVPSANSAMALVEKCVAIVHPTCRAYTKEQLKNLFQLLILEKKNSEECGIKSGTAYGYWNKVKHLCPKEKPDTVEGIVSLPVKKLSATQLPSQQKSKRAASQSQKLLSKHSQFLSGFYEENGLATIGDGKEALCEEFNGFKISISGLHNHLKKKCILSMHALSMPAVSKAKKNRVDSEGNLVFVGGVDYLMFMRQSFGWPSKKELKKPGDLPRSAVQSGILLPILVAFNEKGIVNMSAASPYTVVQEDKGEEVDTLARKLSFFKTFLKQTMDIHEKNDLEGSVLVLSDREVFNTEEIKDLVRGRDFFLELDEGFSFSLFWWSLKTLVDRSRFDDDRTLIERLSEAAGRLQKYDLQQCIQIEDTNAE